MNLKYKGHNYIYAVEQMCANLFPLDKDIEMETSLSTGKIYATASCRFKGEIGIARCRLEELDDSRAQSLLKTAIYRAALKSGMARPPWGSLSGVRPGKLMKGIMNPQRFSEIYDVSPERSQLCYETSLFTIEAEKNLGDKDICLYVGIPFCPTRCAYCSFVSQSTEKSWKLMDPFFDALLDELKAVASETRELGLKIVSIYFGGGTPTTLSAEKLELLCTEIEKDFDLSGLREFCVEAGRPDTITEEKLTVLKTHGVDRLSVNPQTMKDAVLLAIGRKHTAQDIRDALELVRKVGGFSVNMDLIAGLPSDTVEGFKESMDEVVRLNPENITVHTLSLKRGSSLLLNGGAIPSEMEVSQMLDHAYASLRGNGYRPYYLYRQKNMQGGFENTGWTKPNCENLYNICMMEELCSILAAGGGGSTKLIRRDGGKNIRLTAPKYPQEYIENSPKTCAEKAKIGQFYKNQIK